MRYLIIIALLLMCSPAWARSIDTIIVHHTASDDVSAYIIDQWHRERGWDGIGYHYVIRKNGDIEYGRPEWKPGAHAKGRNRGSIGVVLTGYDEFTPAQISSLKTLLKRLQKKYKVTAIERHHEKCPGATLDLETISGEIL